MYTYLICDDKDFEVSVYFHHLNYQDEVGGVDLEATPSITVKDGRLET